MVRAYSVIRRGSDTARRQEPRKMSLLVRYAFGVISLFAYDNAAKLSKMDS